LTILIKALLCPPHGHPETAGIFPAKNGTTTVAKSSKYVEIKIKESLTWLY
jgi:hypothetical protein